MRSSARFVVLAGLVVLGSLVLASCGRSGDPGQSGLGVWVEYSEADEIYYISTSTLPTYFSYGFTMYGVPQSSTTYYAQDEGTTSYAYQLRWWDSSSGVWHYSTTWYGTMTIEREPGAPGGLISDGADGADRYYDWILGWSGSTLTWGYSAKSVAALQGADGASSVHQAGSGAAAQVPPVDPALFDIGPVTVTTFTDGPFRVTIAEYGCTPKGSTPEAAKPSAR